jgi:hypothetical protein
MKKFCKQCDRATNKPEKRRVLDHFGDLVDIRHKDYAGVGMCINHPIVEIEELCQALKLLARKKGKKIAGIDIEIHYDEPVRGKKKLLVIKND